MEQNQPILLVDTSYCCFYRYHALCNWYKLAHPEENLDFQNIMENSVFLDKFHKKFMDMILELIKKYSSQNIIMAMDGQQNWRKPLFKEYKKNRKNSNSQIYDDQVFQYLLNTIIPELSKKYNISHLLEPTAEGDDIIAVIKKHLRTKYPDKPIIIISSDTDLCQLIDSYTTIYDLKNKNLNLNLSKENLTPIQYLKQKCIIGDKSDNIPSIFPKCGKKTSIKYLDQPELLEMKLKENLLYREQYELNQLLIDFDKIPETIQNLILQQYDSKYNE